MGITPGEWYFWSGCEGTVKFLGGEMWDSEFYFKRLKLVPWLLKPQYQEERKNPSCLGLLNFTMVLNWEIKPYLRASHHSQGQFHCGPIIHPRYHFGTEEANVHHHSHRRLAGCGGSWCVWVLWALVTQEKENDGASLAWCIISSTLENPIADTKILNLEARVIFTTYILHPYYLALSLTRIS